MSKLGLLKDSDFKVMHDRKLPVGVDDLPEVERFIEKIIADVRFLEGLRIMDYSLFLIVLEVPPQFAIQMADQSAYNATGVPMMGAVGASGVSGAPNVITNNMNS
jgi:hypothetical protein